MHDETDQSITSSPLIPDDFFEDMESSWKGRVKRVHAEDAFNEVEREAKNLINVVRIFNRIIFFSTFPIFNDVKFHICLV